MIHSYVRRERVIEAVSSEAMAWQLICNLQHCFLGFSRGFHCVAILSIFHNDPVKPEMPYSSKLQFLPEHMLVNAE